MIPSLVCDANTDTICLLRCPAIPVAGEIALLLFIALILLLEYMIYGNEG